MILVNPDGLTYQIKELPKAKQERMGSCIVNIDDTQLLMIGGKDYTRK